MEATDRATATAGPEQPLLGLDAAGEPGADDQCGSCGEVIPPDSLRRHLAGLDGSRLECPRQDLRAILERDRTPKQRLGWNSFVYDWRLRAGDRL